MVDRHQIALAKQLLQSDEAARIALIQASLDLMDAEFFEHLKQLTTEPASRSLFSQIVRLHLELSGSQYVRHYELTIELGKAFQQQELDKAISAHQDEIDEDLVDTLIKSASDSIDKAGFLPTGLMLLQIAQRVIDRLGYTQQQPHCWLMMSSYYLMAGDNDQAQQIIQQAKNSPVPEPIRQSLWVNEGLIYYRQGQFARAVKFYQQHNSHIQNHRLWLDAQSNLAMSLRELGQFSQALKLLQTLVTQCKLPDDADRLARIYGNMAVLYSTLGVLSEELKYLHGSIEAAKSQSDYLFDWNILLTSYINLTLYYLRQKVLDKAEYWFKQYKDTAEKADTESQLVTYARVLCQLHYVKGNHAQALQVIANIRERFAQRNDPEYLSFLLVAGTVEYRIGQYQAAQQTLGELWQRANKTHSHELMQISSGYLGLCADQFADYVTADRLFTQVFTQTLHLRNHIHEVEHQFRYSTDKQSMHLAMIGRLSARNKGVKLFDLLQKVKSQALGHQLNMRVDFASIRQSLPAGAVLLEYYLQEGKAFCMLVSSQFDQPIYCGLNCNKDTLQQLYQRYQLALQAAPYTQHNPFDLQVAYDLLIAPLLPWLKNHQQLIIAASSWAYQLPFAIFPLPGGEYLIDRFALSYVPVGGVFQVCQTYPVAQQNALVMAVKQKNDAAIIGAQFVQEAKQVADILQVAPYLDAPNSAALLLEFKHARVIHVASHGSFNPTNPLRSGLCLQQQKTTELLPVETWIEQLKSAELIFLSGCDTGKVELLDSDEVLGPLSLFLTRQVASLALSHWQVPADDPNIPRIVVDFYRNWLVNGMDKAVSLQQAMIKNRQGDNPYRWAGFFLSGAVG